MGRPRARARILSPTTTIRVRDLTWMELHKRRRRGQTLDDVIQDVLRSL